MEININDYVEVVLTQAGADTYNTYWNDISYRWPGFVEKNLKEGDVLKEQLWSVMQIFGPHIHLGGHVPFVMCRMNILEGK
jgi:hypothetical protein